MNQFQQELQSLNLNDYQTGNVVYWDQQQSQYPYYYIQDDARRCGGCMVVVDVAVDVAVDVVVVQVVAADDRMRRMFQLL